MKYPGKFLTAIVTCLLFSSADVFAQHCCGGGQSDNCVFVRMPQFERSRLEYVGPNVSYYDYVDVDPRYTEAPGMFIYERKYYDFMVTVPQFGKVVSKKEATKKSFLVDYPLDDFFYRDGIFYLHDKKNDRYEIQAPHVGFRVPNLPESRRVYQLNGETYTYAYGSFFKYVPSVKQYEVVAPPVGAVVDWVPSGAEKIVVEDDRYCLINGVQYLEIILKGRIWYKIVMVDSDLYSSIFASR